MINVVLFGVLGCGKSSIINLLSDEPIAEVSTGADPCTDRPRWYEVSIDGRRFRLWDTMGFHLARGGHTNPLLPCDQAHAVLRNLTDGINLILLCARKGGGFASLGGLYRLINDFFYGGHAPIAIVVTQCDTPDIGWWERNQNAIAQKTSIPVHSIPHACITAIHWQTGYHDSKQTLKALLKNYATAVPPITLRLDLSSYTTASLRLANHCGLSIPEATSLVEQFGRPLRPFNVVLIGETGVGKSSIINLLVGDSVAETSSGINRCTLDFRSYKIKTGTQQFYIWDTVGFNGIEIRHDMCERAIENAIRLVHDLSRQGGIDLLVFCKKHGRHTPSELNFYKLFEEFLCKGQVPVAVVITHLEFQNPMDKWWELNGESFVKALGRDVIGHACITSLPLHDPHDQKLRDKILSSRLSVQAMLEDCLLPRSTLAGVEGIPSKQSTKRSGDMSRAPRKMTVKNLMDGCGLTKEQATEVIKLLF